jgi:hypothetical protein
MIRRMAEPVNCQQNTRMLEAFRKVGSDLEKFLAVEVITNFAQNDEVERSDWNILG